jgi:uncharacterized protein YhaN
MKLHKATLKNYRRHPQLEVSFDDAHTLITGPNEAGKSTLIEAIHRCLFYRYKSKAAGLLERMQSRSGGVFDWRHPLHAAEEVSRGERIERSADEFHRPTA